jgi:hypothetical protein
MSFVTSVLAIGLGSIVVKPKRGFVPNASAGPVQPFVAHATLEEIHRDDLEITDHPVEGAMVSDHAYMRPAEVVIRCAWSNSPPPARGGIVGAAVAAASANPVVGAVLGGLATVNAASSLFNGGGVNQINLIYEQLRDLQQSRVPFDVYTGKRSYKNMLFKSLSVTTDADNENALILTAVCRQVIIVTTSTIKTPVNASAQALPSKTSPLANAGQKQAQLVRDFVNPEFRSLGQ